MQPSTWWFLSTLVLLGGCAAAPLSGAPDGDDSGATGDGPLVSSLQVEATDPEVFFTLQVTNTSAEPVRLTFPTGQSFDFVVLDRGRELWRWSADQMFTQAFRTEVLPPGETRRYQASWRPPAGLSGQFTARGVLTAQEPREQAAVFQLR